jgi:hypothetical protein
VDYKSLQFTQNPNDCTKKLLQTESASHWYPAGKSIFLTWRLYGSLPQSVINWLRMARQRLRKPELSSEARLLEFKKLFGRIDSLLDRATSGPLWLKNAEIASLIQAALLERYAYLYTLWAYVVMANHVHIFLKPKGEATLARNYQIPQRLYIARSKFSIRKNWPEILAR